MTVDRDVWKKSPENRKNKKEKYTKRIELRENRDKISKT